MITFFNNLWAIYYKNQALWKKKVLSENIPVKILVNNNVGDPDPLLGALEPVEVGFAGDDGYGVAAVGAVGSRDDPALVDDRTAAKVSRETLERHLVRELSPGRVNPADDSLPGFLLETLEESIEKTTWKFFIFYEFFFKKVVLFYMILKKN